MKTDDIVTRLREMLDGPVPYTVEPQDLRDAIAEIERLREAGDWLWEAMSRHDNTRECPQCQDMIQAWKAVRGGQ